MKIEKISDYQIRCTLTRADLADRRLPGGFRIITKQNHLWP